MFEIIKTFAKTLIIATLFLATSPLAHAYSPQVFTNNATTNVTPNSATLSGSVNTGGLPTSVWFEYGVNGNNFISSTNMSFTAGYNGNFSVNISGLIPNTNYSFRAIAQNQEGRVYGNIYSFTTSYYGSNPNNFVYNNTGYSSSMIITESATFVENRSVQLNALIYNAGNYSSTWFEWGATMALGNKTTIITISPIPYVRHADNLKGLSPGTTYYFKSVIENSVGRNEGVMLSFTTGGSASSVVSNVNQNTSSNNYNNTNTSVTETVQNTVGANLGANVFSTSSFFPVNLFGWLLLVTLILLIVFVVRRISAPREVVAAKAH